MTAAVPAIAVRQLSKTFGDGELAVHAVSGIDLDVATGEVVLVMGPSGSGKTTLLLMLGAMLRPTGGSVVIDGVDLATAPERRLPSLRATHLGFIFQDFNLLSALTALENVQLACNLAGTTWACRSRPGHRAARPRRARPPARVPSRPALRWREARRHRPRPGQQPDRAARRRAHRQPRLEPRPRSPGSCAVSPRRTDAASSSSATTSACARSPTGSSGWRTACSGLAAMATDPVCGMAVEQDPAMHLQDDAQEWWFCSNACRADFAAHPDRYRQ